MILPSLLVRTAFATTIGSCSAEPSDVAPSAFANSGCRSVCSVSAGLAECELDQGTTTAPKTQLWMATDFEEAANDTLSVFGYDNTGAAFCCYVEDASDLVALEVQGLGSSTVPDEIRLSYSGAEVSTQVNVEIPGVAVFGNAGADLIQGSNFDVPGCTDPVGTDCQDEELYGGAGVDTIYGNAGHDLLVGGVGADLLYGGDHRDLVIGEGGGDTIFGGLGDDHLRGGDDNDVLYGEAGDDVLYGDAGIDWLYGDGNADVLYGGDQNDLLYGGSNDDVCYGDAGNDVIYGENGADNLIGGEQDDFLYGGGDNDNLNGGLGNDILDGGASNDTLTGNAGDDLLCSGGGVGNWFDSGADSDKLWADSTDTAPSVAGASSPASAADACCGSGSGTSHGHGAAWAGLSCGYILTAKPTGCL